MGLAYKKRALEKKIEKLWNEKEIIIIKGPRQAGKTTLMKYLNEKYGGSYYTLEDDDVLRTFDRNPELLVDNETIFIDEVQLSEFAGKKIKRLYDKFEGNVKFVMSGSGAFDIAREVGASLVGRAFFLTLLPLSFEEFLSWNDEFGFKLLNENKKNFLRFIKEGRDIFPIGGWEGLREFANEYMIWGGYPAVVLSKDREIKREKLKGIVDLTIERDLVRLFSLQDIGRMKKFVKTLSSLTGRLLNFSNLGVDFKTAEKYIGVLEHSQIISLIEPFYKNERTVLKKAKKLYFYDLGFRNAILNNFTDIESRENSGFLIENFVMRQLIENFEIRYWRTTGKTEVDFVIEAPVFGMEVKSAFTRKVRGLKSFIKKYNSKGMVLCDRFSKEEILYYPFWLI